MANAEQQPGRRHVFLGHKTVNDLKKKAGELGNPYLSQNPPQYPQPEFEVSRVKYNPEGHEDIQGDERFRQEGNNSFEWWSLVVGEEEITSAEEKKVQTNTKEKTKLFKIKKRDLEKFATSPAFQQDSCGSTYPLQKVLKKYSKEFCNGKEPTMRAFRTYIYGQEVLYTVLVHRPCDDEVFYDYPLLTDTPAPVCAYRNGCIIWKAQAMCGTHSYKLRKKRNEDILEASLLENEPKTDYVWDHVSVALHVGKKEVKSDDNKQNPAEDEKLAALFERFHV